VQGLSVEADQPGPGVGGQLQAIALLLDGLLQPGGRLAGRGGQGHERGPPAGLGRLFSEQRQHPGDRGGLARPRPAGDHRKPPQDGGGRRQALQVRSRPFVEPGIETSAEHVEVDAAGPLIGPGEQVRGHLSFGCPVPVEVEQAPFYPERPVVPREGTFLEAGDPAVGRRPGQVGYVRAVLVLAARRRANGRQVDADVPEPRGPHREGRPEQHGFVIGAAQGSEAQSDVHIGGMEDPGEVEGPQRRRRPQGQIGVEGGRTEDRGHAVPPRSKRSLRASTSDPEGHQDQTPQGWPSTLGKVGLLIPRKNR
jgi:hypothetical protein